MIVTALPLKRTILLCVIPLKMEFQVKSVTRVPNIADTVFFLSVITPVMSVGKPKCSQCKGVVFDILDLERACYRMSSLG